MIAAVPAMLVIAVTLAMLLLDVFAPGMPDRQFLLYPVMMKAAGLLSLICGAICFISELYNGRLRLDVQTLLFAAFALCIIVSTCVNGFSQEAVFGMKYRYIGVLDLFVYMAAYMYCSGRIRSSKVKMAVLTAFMLTSDLIAIAFLYSGYTGEIEAFYGMAEPGAIFFHGNHYGYFLVVAVVLSAACYVMTGGAMMIIGAVSLALTLIALAVNRTMGSLLAAGIVLLVMLIWTLIRNRGRAYKALALLVLFAAAVLGALIFMESFRRDLTELAGEAVSLMSGKNDIYAGNGRWGIWQATIGFIMKRPLLGYGCEGISEMLYDIAVTSSPHNELLTYAAYFGIPAAAVYTAAVIAVILKGVKADNDSDVSAMAAFAALGYFVSSLFGVLIFYTAPFLFIMLGLAGSESEYGEQ